MHSHILVLTINMILVWNFGS